MTDAELVRMALDEHHIPHELTVLRDGITALSYASEMKDASASICPDIVLLDMNVPPTTGATILTELRKCAGCATTPVIVVSCSDRPEDRSRMAALGVNRYIRKAMDLKGALELGGIVKDVLQEAKVNGESLRFAVGHFSDPYEQNTQQSPG